MNEEAIANLITFLNLAVGIISIIAIIKFFSLAKDVKEIRQKNVDVNSMIKEAKVYYLKGDLEKAKDILDTAFYSEMLAIDEPEGMFAHIEKELITKYKTIYSSLKLEIPNTDQLMSIK